MSLQTALVVGCLAVAHTAELSPDLLLSNVDTDYSSCRSAGCFNYTVNWSSGTSASTLPTYNFSLRKIEFIYYPPDGNTYAYADIVNYSDIYYPDSYNSEVGVFSSPNGKTNWKYHGIVVGRGPSGGWDSGGIASPGAAVAQDGSVLVGYTAENGPHGGPLRGIGVAVAPHPLGPFTKNQKPVASTGAADLCRAPGRCDDVIMQSMPNGEINLYHSVKGTPVYPGGGAIVHHITNDSGKTWINSTVILECGKDVPCVETIAGRWFQQALGGRGAMVLVCDGAPNFQLTAFMSPTMSKGFQVAGFIEPHPPSDPRGVTPNKPTPGDWAELQVGFVPNSKGDIVGIAFSLWTDTVVPGHGSYHGHKLGPYAGYTHTIYDFHLEPDLGEASKMWV